MKKIRNPYFRTQFITAAISTTLVLVLLGIIVLFVLAARNYSNDVKENISVTLLLSDDLDAARTNAMQETYAKAPYTKSVHYISKEQALAEETVAMGIDSAEVYEMLGENPYTSELEIRIKADYVSNDSLKAIVAQMKSAEGVIDVAYSPDLTAKVNDRIQKISLILLVIAGLFTYISFALINNTIRLSIFSKRFIINTMKLVGASWSFIRRPFLIQSIVLGIISAVLALSALAACLYFLKQYDPSFYNVAITHQVIAIMAASVFSFGILITLICSYFSLNKYLKMRRNDMYYQ